MSVSAVSMSPAMSAWAQAMAPQGFATQPPLTEQELEQIKALAARDQEVRQHEAAHQAAGGPYTGPASYTLERGPDGKMYAVDGEVRVDTSKVSDDPQATIEKMRTVHAAAMAPATPSTQDRRVAAEAMITLLEAQRELAEETAQQAESDTPVDVDIDTNTA